MRIHSLTMKNFRGFEDATLDLDRPLTVLFGVNGSGKSSVLMAIAIVLSEAQYPLDLDSTAPWVHNADDSDVRRGAKGLSVTVRLVKGDVVKDIGVAHSRGERAPGPNEMRSSAISAKNVYRNAPTLSVLYEAARDVAHAHDAFSSPENGSSQALVLPSSATHDALVVGQLKFRSLFQWFKGREDVENELKVSKQDLSLEDPQLSAVRRAVAGMLPGFSGLRIQRDPLHMVIRKGDEVLEIDQLSDGEKLTLALAADLARRLAIAYAGQGDPLQGEAIVLIDEVELHLHPAWQRRVLGAMRSTFPNCQFIVTTHSPQVLSEVPNEAVVLVDDFKFTHPGAPTAGRDSNAILTEVMGTPERPQAKLDAIRAISALLDEGNLAEARIRLDALAQELSERDREVVGLRTMLHFLEDGDETHPQGG